MPASAMKIWLLKRAEKEYVDYDEMRGAVLIAPNEHYARKLASLDCGAEGAACWTDEKRTTCEELTPGDGTRVVLVDTRAG